MKNFIKLQNVNVYYNSYKTLSERTLKNKIFNSIGGSITKYKNKNYIHALKNLNLEITNGDKIGVVGPNGSGKSTFLRLLAGCIEPWDGKIIRYGKINSILSLNMGLDPELTGYENIKLQSKFRSYSNAKYNQFLNDIINFSDLDEFLNLPVESFSSGMALRLAFAIATYENPEILILDEIVNVGDKNFAEKSKQRINKLIENSKIFVLASHDENIIKYYCNKLYKFNKGELLIEKIY